MKELKEQPLGYWEEESYMLIVPREANEELLDGIIDRVSSLKEVEIKESNPLTEESPGRIKLIYQKEELQNYFVV